MDRTLVLIRHGKSDWSGGEPDRDRPIAARGREQAPRSGAWLAEHGPVLDLALVSPALRARQTWDLVAAGFAAPPRSVVDERVYTFDADDLREVLADDDACVACLALVGHDPALSDLAGGLVGQPVPMPTSAVAVIALPDDAAPTLLAAGRPPRGPLAALPAPRR